MTIDITFLVLLALGFYLGFSRGLIHAVFSFIALFLGVAVAVKWSHTLSLYMANWTGSHSQAWPIVSFILLFALILIIMHLISDALENTFSKVGLGFLNKFAGAFLWCLILTFIFSVFLWFADQLHWISPQLKIASTTYNYIQPIAPAVIHGLGNIVPWFKDEFNHLEELLSKHTPDPPAK